MSQTEDADCDMQVKIQFNEKQSKNEDELMVGTLTGISDTPELNDPAILEVREIPKYRYSKDVLMKLREAPLSRKTPTFLNTDEVSPSIWDPERWNERKKSSTPTENGPRSDQPENRRRPGDPRERIRKENDGIVLSPQRRSFNSGCFVPVREQPPSRTNRPHSPLGKNENPHMNVREIQPGTRRIGSGRILRDAWDYGEKQDGGEIDYNFRGQPRNNEDDRRQFGREFDMREKEKDRRSSRFNERRRINNEEPEWFSSGPMSQNDTIELRGFDESEKLGSKKKMSSSQAKRVREWAKKKGDSSTNNSISEDQVKDETNAGGGVGTNIKPGGATNKDRTTPTPQDGVKGEVNAKDVGDNDKENRNGAQQEKQVARPDNPGDNQTFNFDDILKCDSIPGLLTNGVGGDGDNNTKSRFSRWFKRESPEQSDSRRSSLQEDHLLKNLLNDINEPTVVAIPGDSESYFAPISPAANTGGVIGQPGPPQSGTAKPLNIMEMFQRGKHQPPIAQGDASANAKPQFPGKIISLNELESRMRKGVDISGLPGQQKPQIKQEEDMSAFKKLLAQVSGGHVIQANNGPSTQKMPPMSLMEMLSHSQQQDEAQARMSQPHLLGPASPNPATRIGSGAAHMSGDFPMKVHQVPNQQQHVHAQQRQQLEMLNKLVGNHPLLGASPFQEMGPQQSRELLSRPEAQAILQGLKRGDITPQHLYQQLANPALQPRHREMLFTILKMQTTPGGIGPSPRVLSPVPPPQHHMFQQQQQQQQLRVSPLPPTAMHQRIPSPRELQVHTQNILQRALIKKKLEEQQENFRKKQELQQRGQSPNNNNNIQPNKSVSSPTPLAFTPTSVLRKMTADKDDGAKDVKNLDGTKMPQGRAVTGVRIQSQVQQPQNTQWNAQYPMKQPAGRPIVKANSSYQSSSTEQFFNNQQQRLFGQQQSSQQQQQLRKPAQAPQQQGGSVGGGQYAPSGGPNHGNSNQYNSSNHQQSQFPQLTQQQLRAQHQQHARPTSNQQPQPQQQQPQQAITREIPPAQQQVSPNYHQHQSTAWQQFLSTAAQQNNRNQNGRGGLTDGGDLSPSTSNQLARWFSPDLLERARGGQLPSTAGLAQHVVSLEEIERQTAPPVHN